MANLNEVRWGIIGVGDVCEVKSGPAFQAATGSRLVAVMRRDGAKAADYARRHGVARWYDDADALIADPEVNAVYLATPPGPREDYTRRAAAAGKAVYVEKPMARTSAECRRMIEVCAQADVKLFVAYYRRRLPSVLKVEALLREGAIGAVRHVAVKLNQPLIPPLVGAARDPLNWRLTPEFAGGGYFFDLASHQLDALDYLLGPIEVAAGIGANRAGAYATNAEDTTVGHWRHRGGVLGQGVWCFCAGDGTDEEEITLIGSAGEIRFNCFRGQQVALRSANGAEERFSFELPRHIQQPLIQTIVDDLRGLGTCPSTGESGARTSWVLEQLCRRSEA